MAFELSLFLALLLFGGSDIVATQASVRQEFVAAHNKVRAKYRLPGLVWSDALAQESQVWANYLADHNEFRHDNDHSHGQNLFAVTNGSVNATFVVNDWASESSSYDLGTNTCSDVCGHFTQTVWKETRRVGCAVARRRNREVWVCDYFPPGNVVGEKPY